VSSGIAQGGEVMLEQGSLWDILDLLDKHKENLSVLEVHAATYGGEDFAPIHLRNDLAMTREAIARLEAKLKISVSIS
jgi:hypothetical protein